MNGNGAEMSAEASGIAVCLIEYSHHACRTECDAMTEHYYRLRDYALQHPESTPFCALLIEDTYDGTVNYPTNSGTTTNRTTHGKTRLALDRHLRETGVAFTPLRLPVTG
jgi:hypothetical protein